MKLELNSQNYLLIVVAIASFLTAFITNAASMVIPYVAVDLGMNNIVQNWVATIFLLTIAVFSVPLGALSGKYGLKKSFILGLLIFLFGSIFCVVSFDSITFLSSRTIQGIGATFLNVAGMALVVSSLPPEHRGRGIGINVAFVYIGLSLAPVLAGVLTNNFGWRSIFCLAIPFLIFILFITIFKVKEAYKDSDKPFDWKGSIVYSFGILSFVYGFTILNQLFGQILVVIGLALLTLFAFIELNTEFPVFEVRLFKNSKFLSSNIASLISYLATFVTTLIINYHLQYIRGFDPQSAGFIIVILPVMMAIVAPFAGRLSDRIKPQILSATGMSIATIALFLMIFLNESTPLYLIELSLFLQGVGFGLFGSPNTSVIMGSVHPRDIPSASSAVSTVRVVGQTMSMGMLTVIFAIVMGSVKIIPQYYPQLIQSSQIAFAIASIFGLIAIATSLVGLKSKDSYSH